MSTLLIGGSGFIGSALGPALIACGDQVRATSRSAQAETPGIEWIKADLYDEPLSEESFEGIDHIYVLIGQAYKDFDTERELRTLGPLFEAALKGKQRLTYLSTSFVYGHTGQAATELTECRPIGPYAEFKLAAESLAKSIVPAAKLTILRLANIYGTTKNKGVLNFLLNNIREGRLSMELNGNGQQLRDYLLVDDLVQAMIAIKHEPSESGITNVSTGQSRSLLNLVHTVSKLVGKEIETTVNGKDMTGIEPQDLMVDNRRLREAFGFNQFTSFEDGLKITLERYGIDVVR